MPSAAITLPLRPVSAKPFRFQDLPLEIRNKIYIILLCTVHPRETDEIGRGLHMVPDEITKIGHSIQPRILRTCRSVYAEANHVMRQTNLFIKVSVRIPFGDISPIMIAKRLPILQIKKEKVDDFKGFVISHEIAPRDAPKPKQARTFAVLYRDMHIFCSVIEDARYRIDEYEQKVSHIVTFVDPYDEKLTPPSPIFHSQTIQEKLLAPYRKTVRGLPHFEIKGIIRDDLKQTALSQITRPVSEDPEAILREVEEFKAEGNQYYRNKDGENASESWCKGLIKIRRATKGATGQQLQSAGGVDFVNGLAKMTFDLHSNLAVNNLQPMRENKGDPELVRALAEALFQSIFLASTAMSICPGITWQPSPQQTAKLYYREAVASRLIGARSRAKYAIGLALQATPDDAELLREKASILKI